MREWCWTCVQAKQMCYCERIRPFALPFEFVILTHPLEFRRRIATGRMAHLCIANSRMITAENYTENAEVNALLADPRYSPFLMHPKLPSLELNAMTRDEKLGHFGGGLSGSEQGQASGKRPLFFVVDGTWATARKTMRLSENLKSLPRICFRPAQASNFRVRKQPRPDYVSTIEAIHESLEHLVDVDPALRADRPHDHLLEVFDAFVEKHLAYVEKSMASPEPSRYAKARVAAMTAESGPGPT